MNEIKIIKELREEIIEAGVKAYADAWKDRHLQFEIEVQIDENGGKVVTWYQETNGNSFHVGIDGTNIVKIMTLKHTYEDIVLNDGETESEYIEADINNFAYDVVANKLDDRIEELEYNYMA